MAWNLPSLPGVGTVATVANWATKVIDCFNYLKTAVELDGEIFIPVTFATDLRSDLGEGLVYGLINAANEKAVTALKIPYDFVSVDTASLILIGVAAITDMTISVTTNFGAIGQTYSVHSGGGTVVVTTVADTYHIVNLTLNNGLLNLAADDYLAVTALYTVTAPATNVKVVGVRIKYNRA